MKKLMLAVVLGLPLMGLAPATARAWGEAKICLGINFGCFNPKFCIGLSGGGSPCHSCPSHGGGGCYNGGCNGPAQAGPWYLYWPMEAHFQVPAPTAYPYWPAPMTTGAFNPGHATGFQPVGYYGQAPSYWYGQ